MRSARVKRRTARQERTPPMMPTTEPERPNHVQSAVRKLTQNENANHNTATEVRKARFVKKNRKSVPLPGVSFVLIQVSALAFLPNVELTGCAKAQLCRVQRPKGARLSAMLDAPCTVYEFA